jgi:histidine triad (HIT) family protein
MPATYDPDNVFAKILRGEIPCKTVLETPHSLAFHDIAPKAPVHVLVIPRGPYICWDHFAAGASDAEIADYTRAIGEVCQLAGVADAAGGAGYRLIANAGAHGVQEVPHLHIHVMGGHPMGPMVLLR